MIYLWAAGFPKKFVRRLPHDMGRENHDFDVHPSKSWGTGGTGGGFGIAMLNAGSSEITSDTVRVGIDDHGWMPVYNKGIWQEEGAV